MYQNQTGRPVRFMLLPDRTSVWLPADDTIRLYLTRKYASTGFKAVLAGCGLGEVAATHSYFVGDRAGPRFGMGLTLVATAPDLGERHGTSADELWA